MTLDFHSPLAFRRCLTRKGFLDLVSKKAESVSVKFYTTNDAIIGSFIYSRIARTSVIQDIILQQGLSATMLWVYAGFPLVIVLIATITAPYLGIYGTRNATSNGNSDLADDSEKES